MTSASKPVLRQIITPASTVSEVVRHCPETLTVFRELGVDTCCGGGATLLSVARDAHLQPDALIHALTSHAHSSSSRLLRNAPCNCHP